jgi:hypothetical protein
VSAEAAWLIAKSGAISPPTGSVCGAAYRVRVTRGSARREVIVEFADSSAVVSAGYAEEVARQFLRDDEPPQHVIVEAPGTVRVELGPREGVDEDEGGPHVASSPQGRRARSRRR